MMAPCERLSTPETPKISVKPVAPSAYNALMAKPSIRICKASIDDGRGSTAASLGENANAKMLPGQPGSMIMEGSVRRDLDEAWELQLAFGDFFRPHADLLAILPLQHQAGNQALAVFDRMGERIVLAVELGAADGAFPVGLFQRIDHLVRIGRPRALHRVGDVIDFVISGIAGIRGIIAELRLEAFGKGHRLRRYRGTWTGDALIEYAIGGIIGVLAEGLVGRLRGDAEHRDRNLLILPLHRRLHADMRNAGDDHIRLCGFNLVEDRREVRGGGREADMVEHLQPDFRQTFLVSDVERLGPGGILAHDDGCRHAL